MIATTRHYFTSGNTARGFYNLIDSTLQGLERVYILMGAPGTGKSSIMKTISQTMLNHAFNIELIHSVTNDDSLDGLVIPELKVAIVDGTPPNVVEPQAPGAVEQYVNLGVAWDEQRLRSDQDNIKELYQTRKKYTELAYDTFAQGLVIHDDELEQIYFDYIDLAKADKLTRRMIDRFFANNIQTKQATIRRRFLGAATPQGPVDYIENLTENTGQRYFIKGPPGCGKSHLMKKIATEADQRGFDAEVYHCGFDPHSLDMVLLPELDIAIFDSTDPHEHFPTRNSDEIIDMYTLVLKPGTEEKHTARITHTYKRYKAKMKEGTSYLAKAKSCHDELKAIYSRAMDFDKLAHVQHEIQSEIDAMAEMRTRSKT